MRREASRDAVVAATPRDSVRPAKKPRAAVAGLQQQQVQQQGPTAAFPDDDSDDDDDDMVINTAPPDARAAALKKNEGDSLTCRACVWYSALVVE